MHKFNLNCLKLLIYFQGIGEQGKPAHLSAAESSDYDGLYKVNGFNAALSDKIALDRALPDIRHKGCIFNFILIQCNYNIGYNL